MCKLYFFFYFLAAFIHCKVHLLFLPRWWLGSVTMTSRTCTRPWSPCIKLCTDGMPSRCLPSPKFLVRQAILIVWQFRYAYILVIRGDLVAQLVERRPWDPTNSITRGLNPVRSTRKICKSLSESDSLSVCPTPVYTRTHKKVRTLKIL